MNKDMKRLSHVTAQESHYDRAAQDYDAFNEERSQQINKTIASILKKHNVKTIFDMTCGTSSQVLYLAKHGYKVVGSDINTKMLTIATNIL